MENIINEITKLTIEWRSLAGKDHCKDRDFHWYIRTTWSYGKPPVYIVEHHGYILNEITEEYSTYEEALLGLKNILSEKIKEEKHYQEDARHEGYL
jgi:hypothetical protein